MHDSWGCKYRDGCGVSIIYLTPKPSTKSVVVDLELSALLIAQGNVLDVQADQVEESRLRRAMERSRLERDSSEVYPPHPPPGLV
jgi:hypothetical protein